MIEGIDVVFRHIRRPETVAWYRDVLGLNLLHDDGHWAEFSLSDGVRFALDRPEDAPSAFEMQPVVVSFRVRDMEQAVSMLQSRGVHFVEGGPRGIIQDVGPSLVATFEDPEGHRLQLSQRKEIPQ